MPTGHPGTGPYSKKKKKLAPSAQESGAAEAKPSTAPSQPHGLRRGDEPGRPRMATAASGRTRVKRPRPRLVPKADSMADTFLSMLLTDLTVEITVSHRGKRLASRVLS